MPTSKRPSAKTTRPSAAKPKSGTSKTTTAKKKADPKAAPKPTPPKDPKANAAKLTSFASLFARESGTDTWTIFGMRGPAYWVRGMEASLEDLNLWRQLLDAPDALAGKTWQAKQDDKQYGYSFAASPDQPGHILAQRLPASATSDDEEGNLEEQPIFVGAKYGHIYMVFGGSPTSFADGNFQPIYDMLRLCGVSGEG